AMTSTTSKRRPGPVPRFTRETVAASALSLIDEGPPDSFTMRRLATELGVNPMTIYGYVESKDDMIEAAAVLATEQAHVEPDPGAPLRDRLRAAVYAVYNICVDHPNLARMALARPASNSPGLFQNREALLRLLREAGLDETPALQALGILTYYALGFGIGQADLAPLPDLPADRFPALTGAAGGYGVHASVDTFDLGLQK